MATKAELLEKAKGLGLEADESMTNKQLQDLIDTQGGAGAEVDTTPVDEGTNALMLLNVKHNGTFFKKGSRVMLADEDLSLFVANEWCTAETVAGVTPSDDSANEDDEEGEDGEETV